MTWFLFALVCLLGWGSADLFYKRGTDESDPHSHLKIAVWVGLVMGISSFCLLPFAESAVSPRALLVGAVKYAPASIGYIVSMVIGYAGLRYLELSIISPVQNASGALSALSMLIFFVVTGRIGDISEEFSPLDLAGTATIVLGVIFLAIEERRLSRAEIGTEPKKYRSGAPALIFPLLYCVFDTLGTAADGIILDEETGLGLGEIDVLILYGLTFFLVGIADWIFLWISEKKPYVPLKKSEIPKGIAAVCEEFGQVFYVFAMAKKPMLAAPMIASYCIVSVLFSRIFLKEKLAKRLYFCILPVILGILCLGISEGLAE